VGIYSISDLAGLTGVKTHTLRIWEKRYGLLKPKRTETNIRFYEDEDLQMLRLVQRLNNHGVRISRIASMNLAEMTAECNRLQQPDEERQAALLVALASMDVTQTESILDQAIRQDGFDRSLESLIIPTLAEMEVLTLSGKITEAHEAFFRELIKRKASREIDAMPHNCSGPKVMMFLPEGNDQDLSHLFLHYYLRQQGLCVTDMGCDISLDCVTAALQKCTFECIIVLNADPVHWQFHSFIQALAQKTSLPVIVSGKASEEKKETEDNIIVLSSMPETIQFVSRLKENLQHHLS
jgi:DNA-binding transcriptional MerR regulator